MQSADGVNFFQAHHSLTRTIFKTQIRHRDAEYTEKKSGPDDIRPSQICPFVQLRDEVIRGHSSTGAVIKADTKAPGPRNCSGRPGLQGRSHPDTRSAADRTNRTLKNDPSQLSSSVRASRARGCGTRRIKGAQWSVHLLSGRYKSLRAPQLQRAPWATRRPVRVTPKFHARPQLRGRNRELIRSARISIIASE